MAVIRGRECYCGYPTGRFSLHDGADGLLCSGMHNAGSAAKGKYCLVYQTPVQGTSCSLIVPGPEPPLLEIARAPLLRWVKVILFRAVLATMVGITIQAGI